MIFELRTILDNEFNNERRLKQEIDEFIGKLGNNKDSD